MSAHVPAGEGEHNLRVSALTVAASSLGAFGENSCPRCELLF